MSQDSGAYQETVTDDAATAATAGEGSLGAVLVLAVPDEALAWGCSLWWLVSVAAAMAAVAVAADYCFRALTTWYDMVCSVARWFATPKVRVV